MALGWGLWGDGTGLGGERGDVGGGEAEAGEGFGGVLAEGGCGHAYLAGGEGHLDGETDVVDEAGDGVLQLLDHATLDDVGVLVDLGHVVDGARGDADLLALGEPFG